MEIVHVLCAEEEAVLQIGPEAGESEVAGIGLRSRSHASAHGIKLPHQSRVAAKRLGRPDFLDTVGSPQAASTAKSWNAALGADSGARKNEHAVLG